MIDIRWRFAMALLASAVVSGLLALATRPLYGALLFAVLAVGMAFFHLYWLQILLNWVAKPDINTIPLGRGIWQNVFAMLFRYQRVQERTQAEMLSELDSFQHAASALPDAVVLLSADNLIEWCNPPAEALLGLSLTKDRGQPITYLVRDSEFLHFLNGKNAQEPLRLRSWQAADAMLEIQIIPYGSNKKLVMARDISAFEKIDTMRRDFIANVSHELRTPLTVVGGFLETLEDMGAIPEQSKPYFTMMQEQTARMRHLVEDLLTLSQLENSSAKPEYEEIDMNALLTILMNEATGLSAGQHKLLLHELTHARLIGSHQEIHSALGNLISNAIRYTPEGGTIELFWRPRGEEAVFAVKDDGIGIDMEHLPRITERFYRVDKSRSRQTGGTGLGLSIVKHILNRHQAHLEVYSEPGLGSTFEVVFPANRVVQAQ